MSCCDCNETPATQVAVTQANGCTTIVVNGTPFTWCEGSKVSCTAQPDGSHIFVIDGVACVIPAPVSVECVAGGIEIDGVLCPMPTISVVDNGDCTGTITLNGVTTNFIIEEKDPDQHPPTAINSPDGSIEITTSGQTFSLSIGENQVAAELAGNPTAVGILCTALTPCVTALIAAIVPPAVSTDAGNIIDVGSDGGAFVTAQSVADDLQADAGAMSSLCTALTPCITALIPPPTIDINVGGVVFTPATTTLTLTETDGSVHNVNLAALVNPDQIIVSANAGNIVDAGTDGGALVTAQSLVNELQANPTAHCDLVNGLVDPLVTTLGVQNTQTAQVDLAPAGTENHGLTVDATNPCSLVVPYASRTAHGVVERADFATMEAMQDHNLFTGNVVTTLSVMNEKFRLDDVRYFTARTTQEWFDNNYFITTNRTYNIPSARFPTVVAFEDYLKDYAIKPGISITVNVAAGTYAGLLRGHPQGNQVVIIGAPTTGAAIAATDFASTGNTAAAIAADYATNVAFLESKFTTILESTGAPATAGTVIAATSHQLPYRFRNILFRGACSFASVMDSTNTFDNCAINGTASSVFIVFRGSHIMTNNLFVVTDGRTAEIVTGNSYTNHTGVQVRMGSLFVREARYRTVLGLLANAPQVNCWLAEGSDALMIIDPNTIGMKNSGNTNIRVTEGSNIAMYGTIGGASTLTLSNALTGVFLQNGTWSTAIGNTDYSLVMSGHNTNIVAVDSSFLENSPGACSLTSNVNNVDSVSGSSVRLPANTTLVTAGANQLIARDRSSIDKGATVVATSSPAVGVNGNNDSLIYV